MRKLFRGIVILTMMMIFGWSNQASATNLHTIVLRYNLDHLELASDAYGGGAGVMLIRPFEEFTAVVITVETTKPKAVSKLDKIIILFDFDKSDIRDSEHRMLNYVASVLKTNTNINVSIEGHTCSMGSDAYNMSLSDSRAKSVESYLIDKGVGSGQLTTKNFGETKFTFDNATIVHRKLNRRAEVIVTN